MHGFAHSFEPSHLDGYGQAGTAYCPLCDQRTCGRIPLLHPDQYHCSACCKRHPLDAAGPIVCTVHGPVGTLIDGKCRQCLGLRERSTDGRPTIDPAKVAHVLLEALSSSTGIGTVGYIIGGLTYHLPADLREQVQAAWSDALDRWYGAPVEG